MRPNYQVAHSLGLHILRQSHSPHDQSQARHPVENTINSTYSLVSFGVLWKSSSGRTWSLFLFRRLKRKKKKKNERMSRCQADIKLDQVYSESTLINQSTGMKRPRSFNVGRSSCVRHIPSYGVCSQSSWGYNAKVSHKRAHNMPAAPPPSRA